MPRILLCALTLALFARTTLAAGGGGGNVDFDDDVASHFVTDVSRDAVFADSGSNKPIMVLVTQPWCGACKGLKRGVNAGTEVKGLLEKFTVVHAVGDDGQQWQESGHGYVPQTYFFAPDGTTLSVEGPNPKYAHFFPNESTLVTGMKSALDSYASHSEL
jgi:thiol-disulfide isomerase/thioredoxin